MPTATTSGGLLDGDGRPAFPNAAVFVPAAERDFWLSAKPDLSRMDVEDGFRTRIIADARRALEGVRAKLTVVKPGDRIVEGVSLVAAPGHTPGHVAVQVRGGDGPDETLVHLADAAHLHALTLAHPEWKCAYDADPDAAAVTRRRLLTEAAGKRTLLMGYHLPFPALGHVRKAGAGFQWVPAVWKWRP
jgi:glyoxylase-like metal-dependent hydrolase (beta-lactamase superfamily II)